MTTPGTSRLLISCPDQRGIIAAVTSFIGSHGGNIVDADQHTDSGEGAFVMRLEIETRDFGLDASTFDDVFGEIATQMQLTWRMRWSTAPRRRMAVMVSRTSHCVNDLLWRWREGELDTDIPLVIGNHDDLRASVEGFGIRYEHCPVTPETRAAQEARVLALLEDASVDLVVLARYMQVLSPTVVSAYPNRIINIHHSFLPAFQGGRPYHRAHARGVKIIGATAHYVTDDLDEGPIISQATTPVDHRDDVDDLIRKGRDLERMVLADAVRLHLEDRVLVCGSRTVVFG